MPLLGPPVSPGPLGMILPPMPPVEGSRTYGTTNSPTFGSTAWVTEVAAGAEAAGAGSVWATDHLFWGRPAPECLTALAVAAAATRHAAVGTCVLQLPLRAPAAVAKQAASLQALSGGRFVLGVGTGSHEGEYELAGVPFHTRGQALDAGVAMLRAAWRTAEGPGRYRLEPAAAVPVWVGGASPAAIRRAATVGDGWVPLFLAPEQFAASLARLRDLAADAGRDPGAVVPAVVMVVSVGEDARRARSEGTAWLSSLYGIPPKAFERHLVAGPSGHCATVAGAYAEAGAAHVIAFVAGDDALGQFSALAGAYGGLGSGARDVAAGARDDNFQMAEVGA
jgi:alkanesulfonate monooxygenase SsuD/methylene tetrahydromethanopterin reductase-like flavin-dependent oxidoreductase (luciferase family)